ncbi:MAG: hypothetical protein AB1782_00335 [Cyanobacteriota bacterium]
MAIVKTEILKPLCQDYYVLSLSKLSTPLGVLASLYPGINMLENTSDWLDAYFTNRINHYLRNPDDKNSDYSIPQSIYDEIVLKSNVLNNSLYLKSITINYFRGFRKHEDSINFNNKLIVVEGKNSSGKTSLTEAIEWLLTGKLSRREQGTQGTPQELQDFIANQLKPNDETTWVEANFIDDKHNQLTLKRLLIEDYGNTKSSECRSLLLINNKELSKEEENKFLEEFFACEYPILMQHTLGDFIKCDQNKRYEYFESLLNVAEISKIIEKAVISDTLLTNFKSNNNDFAIEIINKISNNCNIKLNDKQFNTANNFDKKLECIKLNLISICNKEFPESIDNSLSYEENIVLLEKEKEKRLKVKFPILEKIKPSTKFENLLIKDWKSITTIQEFYNKLIEATKAKEDAINANKSIDDGKIALAKALQILIANKLIVDKQTQQVCPLCNYQEIKTLSSDRLAQIDTWIPMKDILESSKENQKTRLSDFIKSIENLLNLRKKLFPDCPSKQEFINSKQNISIEIKELLDQIENIFEQKYKDICSFENSIKDLIKEIKDPSIICLKYLETNQDKFSSLLKDYTSIDKDIIKYQELFYKLENTLTEQAKEDQKYENLETILIALKHPEKIVEDLCWSDSRIKAKKELELIRKELINFRERILELTRDKFSSLINEIWYLLRSDTYSYFSNLNIPKAKGKGFKTNVEVKATISTGQEEKEVDALKVFSESQINVIGIAAFIAKSRLIGHKILIFDDPVQSMDDDHFKTFSSKLIDYLIEKGFQVIILTHNDTFMRDISYAQAEKEGYVSCKIRHSRRKGSQFEEGSRKVQERLKIAEKKAEDGDLEIAWRYIRTAIERLYLITYKKYGPENFDPRAWENHTAENMWNQGIGTIITNKDSGMAKKLKEIYDMTHSAGHDKAPLGETDLKNASKDLKKFLNQLQVGG